MQELGAIDQIKVAVPARVCGRLGELPIDLGMIRAVPRPHPVPAVMWRVSMVALDLAGIGIKRERRVGVIIARPIIRYPRPRIQCPQ